MLGILHVNYLTCTCCSRSHYIIAKLLSLSILKYVFCSVLNRKCFFLKHLLCGVREMFQEENSTRITATQNASGQRQEIHVWSSGTKKTFKYCIYYTLQNYIQRSRDRNSFLECQYSMLKFWNNPSFTSFEFSEYSNSSFEGWTALGGRGSKHNLDITSSEPGGLLSSRWCMWSSYVCWWNRKRLFFCFVLRSHLWNWTS